MGGRERARWKKDFMALRRDIERLFGGEVVCDDDRRVDVGLGVFERVRTGMCRLG